MTNPQRRVVTAALKLADLGVVACAFVLAVSVALQGEEHWLSVLEIRIKVRNIAFILAYLGYWHVVFHSFGLYRSYRLSPSSRELRDLAIAVLIGVAPLMFLRGILDFTYVTAGFLAAFTGLAFIGIGAERRLLRVLARGMRRHGRNLRSVIIVGHGQVAFEMAARLAQRSDLGYRIAALVNTAALPHGDGTAAQDHAGSGQEAAADSLSTTDGGDGSDAAADREALRLLAETIDSQAIDEVFVALPLDAAQPLIRAIVSLCEEQGITVRLLSAVAEPLLAHAQLDELDDRPVITIFTGPPDSLKLFAKRALDLFGSLLLLIVFAPAFLVVAIAIKLDSRGPVLFIQERVGLNRRRFRAYKFRTMVIDAEQQQPTLESRNEADGPVFKIRNDPRVTRVGDWLRRLSVDELPQLMNVLRGEMSLVGPRPLPLRDVSRIDTAAHKRRFSVKPGITCLWQVNQREPLFADWVKADMEYIDHWSLALDLKILLKTIPAVLSRRGAY
jgi:exopolysaccharide biosynthesis polyprenyl glycosylphosphotransferase